MSTIEELIQQIKLGTNAMNLASESVAAAKLKLARAMQVIETARAVSETPLDLEKLYALKQALKEFDEGMPI